MTQNKKVIVVDLTGPAPAADMPLDQLVPLLAKNGFYNLACRLQAWMNANPATNSK